VKDDSQTTSDRPPTKKAKSELTIIDIGELTFVIKRAMLIF